jgi:hypothetical protein
VLPIAALVLFSKLGSLNRLHPEEAVTEKGRLLSLILRLNLVHFHLLFTINVTNPHPAASLHKIKFESVGCMQTTN